LKKPRTMRLKPFLNGGITEAGCDEAGRGCLSGPVFAAAVILPAGFFHPLLNDSKQLSESVRYELRTVIEKEAITWAVGEVSNEKIDEINILKASFLAMHLAIDKLKLKPAFLLIDGNRFNPYPNIPHKCIVEGDTKFASIAAASVLAKTYRDDYMQKLHTDYPNYGWNKNKGYATASHRAAIEKHGITIHHRRSFKLVEWDLFHLQ
jgi:ribonuclease HII